jgi:hypothetical protein
VPVPTPAATSPLSSPVAVNLGSATDCEQMKSYKLYYIFLIDIDVIIESS